MRHTWTSCETSIARQHQFYDSIRTVKNSNLEEEPGRKNIYSKPDYGMSATCYRKPDQLGKQRCQDWRWILIPPNFCRWYNPHSQLRLKATGNAPRYPWHQQTSRLKMHLGKTKIMCNKHINKDDVIVDGKKIEEIDRYVYLGKMVTKDHDQVQKMKRRSGQGWSAFCKLDNIMRDTLKDRKSTNWIRKQSGVTDIIRSIKERKHRWACHGTRRRDNRWTISHRMDTPWTKKTSRPTKNKMVRRFDTICRNYLKSHCERQEVVESM